MLVAHHLSRQFLHSYSSRFSRHDFTLPQLFACLAVKEMLGRSYRAAELLLRDCPHWCRAIGMNKAPDHNTLCRAARLLLGRSAVENALDTCARWAKCARVLKLTEKPLAGDSTYFDTHHVSRHYERRCAKARRWRENGRKCGRSRTIKRLPKLAVTVSCASHLILSTHVGTGACSDSLHFEKLLLDAWRRVPNRSFTAVFDAGYDAEHNHRIARGDMGLRSIIPPLIGRPTRKGPTGWRGHMKRLLATKASRRRCGYTQRWQVETVMSMIKRNLGDELRGKTARSRKRDMLLKVLTHNLMIIRRQPRVETEHDSAKYMRCVLRQRVLRDAEQSAPPREIAQ
jgi:hypothetical protein